MLNWSVTETQDEGAPLRECHGCHATFVRSGRGKHRYCDACRVYVCKQCGGKAVNHAPSRVRQFCSKSCSSRFTALHSPCVRDSFVKGRQASIRQRAEHLSRLYKGRPQTTKRQRYIHQSASNAIRRGHQFSTWRTAVFTRDNFVCQECGCRGGSLNAHHIKPYSLHPEARWDVDNGVTLCIQCHKRLHKEMALHEMG